MLLIYINVICFGEIFFFFLFLNIGTNKGCFLKFKLPMKNCYICYCRYDDILINGLPDWRQPVFYYRRVRKMSNAELALLLFIILTVGHYAVVWSIYLEKQLVSIGNKSNDLAFLILYGISDIHFLTVKFSVFLYVLFIPIVLCLAFIVHYVSKSRRTHDIRRKYFSF